MAFPSTLDFKLKNNAVLSRSLNQVHVPESGSTALPSQAVYVDLASGRYGSYLDGSQSYLQFRINNLDSVNPMIVDGSALSFFERVVVMSSGTIISDFVSHYGPGEWLYWQDSRFSHTVVPGDSGYSVPGPR